MATVSKTCPQCGASNPAINLSCAACGAGLLGVKTEGKPEAQRHTVRELENAWEAAQQRKNLRSSGGWSILWGAFAILGGLASLEQSGCNGVLVLIGLFLVGTGIAAWRKPSPGALQADAAAMLLVGLWNIAITLTSGDSSQNFWAIAGVVQIVWAVQRFARHSKFARVQHIPEALVTHVEALVGRIQRANVAATGDLIEFQAKGKRWKGQLAPEMVTLVAGNAQEVRFTPRAGFTLTAQEEAVPGKRLKASIRVKADTWTGRAPYQSLQRYEDWQAGRLAPPEMVAQPALGAATPAGVVVAALPLVPAFEYANFWRRAGAMLIDTAIFGIPYLVAIFVLGALGGLLAGGANEETLSSVLAIGNCLIQILGLTGFWLYYALMESSSWQATLGKRALSIIVTDLDGNRISFGRATGRYWAKLLSGLIMGIGYLMPLFTEKKQTLHDTLAGCLVISGKAAATIQEPAEEIPEPVAMPSAVPSVEILEPAAVPTVVPLEEIPEPAAMPTVVPSVETPEPVDVPAAAPATPEPLRRTGEGKLGS